MGVSVWVPFAASAPLQLPDAVQLVALLDDQVIVVDAPKTIDAAPNVKVGAAGAEPVAQVTVRVTVVGFEMPAALEQVSE